MADWAPVEQCLNDTENTDLRLALFYAPLPWYRKSTVCSILLIVGILVFRPLVFIPVISCLTSPIYYREFDENGELATWSWGNRVAAIIFLVLAIAFMVFLIFFVLTGPAQG